MIDLFLVSTLEPVRIFTSTQSPGSILMAMADPNDSGPQVGTDQNSPAVCRAEKAPIRPAHASGNGV